jgi:transcriptional regulator with XRE-family HTH domain
MNIGVAIKTVRQETGMSQVELSKQTGLSQTSISQIEQGVKQPTKKSIERICKALQIPEAVLYIIGIDESDVPTRRKQMFQKLYPEIRSLAIQIIGTTKNDILKNQS